MHATAIESLPVQLPSFVGREKECAEVSRLLGSTRLLTLVGTGGVGKTRLALEVANAVANEYVHGGRLVELASATDPALVAPTVATNLGLREIPVDRLLEAIVGLLAPKHLLLVLDNCEHLVESVADVAEVLLRGCSQLRILATSRQRLGIQAETVWPVPSLALPDTSAGGSDEIAASDAIRLFRARAEALVPSFAVTDRNASSLAQICHHLDGIPLAIELAAARVRVLSPEQILSRLDDRFRFLVGGSRRAPSRQHTLRATLDWSYSLLSDHEKVLLRRVAVFGSNWSLEAVEAIASDDSLPGDEILDALSGLVDRSLVHVIRQDTDARYRLLETVRQYALEKLREVDEEKLMLDRHLRWHVDLAARADLELNTVHQKDWLERLDRESAECNAAAAAPSNGACCTWIGRRSTISNWCSGTP